MCRVADQNDLARELPDTRDLTEHAAGIEDGLSCINAVARALVHQDALTEGVQIHVHDIADDEAVGDSRGIVSQCAQSLRFSSERLVARPPKLRHAQLALELVLIRTQRLARGDAVSYAV